MSDIDSVDLVTFDIFDTLLHRKVLAPVDVFELVRLKAFEESLSLLVHDQLSKFVYDRIEAERKSRQRRRELYGGEGEVTLDEIYQEYGRLTSLNDTIGKFLKSTELHIEKNILVASPKGLEIYNKCRRSGKKIAFISDMYLSPDWLSHTLEDKGFEGAASLRIFVSNQYRVSKHSGQLYEQVRQTLGISPARWLHVGDNRTADIESASKLGIKTQHADWAKVDNRFVPRGGVGPVHLVSSLTAFLDTPQASQYIPEDALESIGYRVFGPLLFGFIAWLTKACKDNKFERLIFVARDGWLLRSLFDRCKNATGLTGVHSTYFQMSRKVGYQVGIREWDIALNRYLISGRTSRSAKNILKNANLDAEKMLHQLARFGLEDIHRPRDNRDHAALTQALSTMFQDALNAGVTNRAKYQTYFDILPEGNGPVGLVDIGWAGNIQKAFVHAMRDPLVRDRIYGFYLGTLESSKAVTAKGLKLQGWLCNGGEPEQWERLLTNGGVELLEFVLTANHGSILGLHRDRNGCVAPIIEELSESEAPYRAKAMRAQAGVRKFFDDYEFLLSLFEPGTLMTSAWFQPFERLVSKPTDLELKELASLTHSDATGANNLRLPLASRQPLGVRILKGRLRRARKKAFWKAAFDKLNKW
ncbi:HAD family hydrolase [Pleomorphomonas carboxyditropha]|uniref:Hydrolase n=1 Tax=Pleomorphomonas carboxyditropha TaxID=2023338 RepID=A0A2G9WNY6_9HYPH|nr:HAD family hydrolase [Pleomorphomonas carboxyditropha]PIO96374.1 hypothetical protein CJ014_25640 [Pleomorphomonas carboxyditropha]